MEIRGEVKKVPLFSSFVGPGTTHWFAGVLKHSRSAFPEMPGLDSADTDEMSYGKGSFYSKNGKLDKERPAQHRNCKTVCQPGQQLGYCVYIIGRVTHPVSTTKTARFSLEMKDSRTIDIPKINAAIEIFRGISARFFLHEKCA